MAPFAGANIGKIFDFTNFSSKIEYFLVIFVFGFTKRLADDKIKECARQLDEILILLLGDTFDKTFTEDELLADYGYPAMADEQLQELKAEWCE